MKKLVVANWKMNPETAGAAKELLAHTDEWLQSIPEPQQPPIVFCPPFIFLEEVSDALQSGALHNAAQLGAQDIALSDDAAQTGEISGGQLADKGVRYVLVGHSERRWKLGESDEVVNQKLHEVLEHGMTPIVCLGEQSRDGAWRDALQEQVKNTFQDVSDSQGAQCILAYEPVWAISTNPDARPDTPESAAESVEFIQSLLSGWTSKVLYGGSVNKENAKAFLTHASFDGVLIGGASLRAEEFTQILSETV